MFFDILLFLLIFLIISSFFPSVFPYIITIRRPQKIIKNVKSLIARGNGGWHHVCPS